MLSQMERVADFMKNYCPTYLEYEDKWLVFNQEIDMWEVYQRKYRAKKSVVLAAGTDADLYNLLKVLKGE